MKAVNRQDMVRAFQAAFAEWDRRYAADQNSGFGPLKNRGAYFADLLDELAEGKPWADIGLGAPAEP